MPSLFGKKVLMVIAPREFRDEELERPKAFLEQAGAEVTIASTAMGGCYGMLGAEVEADVAIGDVRASDFDAVIVVGGMGSQKYLWGSEKLHRLLQDAERDGKVIGGICLSGAALARAGVLAGKRATVWRTPESLAEMEKGKAITLDELVVVDGRVVTADGPNAARHFGERIAQLLGA